MKQAKTGIKIVVDVGGTHTRVASSQDGKTIVRKERFPTPSGFAEGIEQITKVIKALSVEDAIDGVVVGIPGTIDHQADKTVIVSNIPSWNRKAVGKTLESFLNIPVSIANDAELAALGEAVFGAGRTYRLVGYLTVSTGVGGALVIDKKLVPRAYNSEPGHLTVDSSSQLVDSLGNKGTFEAIASGVAFQKRFGIAANACTDPRIWKEHAFSVGKGMLNVILLWSPDVLVVGGGLSLAGDLLFSPLRRFINHTLKIVPPPPIVPSELRDEAGLLGGLAFMGSKE